MRILICGINFAPEPVGIGKYTGEMAMWLAGRGHEVRVVTAPPHNPWWRVPSEFTAWKYHRECRFEFGGKSWLQQVPCSGRMDVFRSPLWVPESPTGIKRLLHLASFGLSSLPVILWQRAWRPELVLLVEPTLFCSLQVLLVAAWSGARAWLQVQDFEVDAAFELGDLSSSLLRNCALAFERRLLRKFDRVSAISGRMVERLISKGVDSSRCVLFPNWVDTHAIYPLSSPSPLRRDLGIDEGKIVVLYSGSMGKKQGLDLLADAARQHFHRSDLLYVFSGEGSYRRAFMEKTRGLSNVVHLPLQPVERLNDLLNLADIHLLPQRADAADLVMPSKLTGMLASGRPIVATARWGTQLAMTVEGCGVVVAPGDLDAFTSAILSLVASKDLRLKLGQEARRYALAHFDLDRILFRFEEAMFAACNRPEIRREAGRLHSTVARVGSSEPRPSMAASESEVAAKTSKPRL